MERLASASMMVVQLLSVREMGIVISVKESWGDNIVHERQRIEQREATNKPLRREANRIRNEPTQSSIFESASKIFACSITISIEEAAGT